MSLDWWSWENPVALWWLFLVCASIVNITFWAWTKKFFYSGVSFKSALNPFQNHRAIIWFSGLYVFGCAFRSFLPRADVQRICLFDTWFSNVFVGRSVATIAEVAFVIQWAIVLRKLSEIYPSKTAERVSKWIVPMIIFAECCSWYAVISTNYLGNSIEESTWAVTYFLIAVAVFQLAPKLPAALKWAARVSVVGCILYVGFMVTVDVPMYVTRLLADRMADKSYFGLADGVHNLLTYWKVTHDIQEWKTEIPWMSLYFSVAVLVSIALCYVPINKERQKN